MREAAEPFETASSTATSSSRGDSKLSNNGSKLSSRSGSRVSDRGSKMSSRGRSEGRSDAGLRRSTSLSAAKENGSNEDLNGTATDAELQSIYAGMQGTGHSVDNMKMNVLKLFTRIQEQESIITEKRREVREMRHAYGSLRTDYEHLQGDLDNAEIRCNRLKQELRREQEMNRDLIELKAKMESMQVGRNGHSSDDRRTCETGNCAIQ
uniref:Uncharacterized protein n=1 Tax=Eutreptiella gymnastica TaxID=73025 RepID=A0A7S1IF60_9EUGL|mmetsp:Transcript_153160/g.267614  ORF Transcript_153160/g.267614 Transcript_153160/m.267614 type:complete len:209 (+) Transcript_153160:384-1010(+)